jgi:hypothetical protein
VNERGIDAKGGKKRTTGINGKKVLTGCGKRGGDGGGRGKVENEVE